MDPIIAYATADWHIPEERGGGAWRALTGIGGDALFGLEQVVALCVRDRADLWAAGDIWDGPNVDPGALRDFYEVLRPLTHTTQKIYYVLGNHDAGRDWLAPLGPTAVRVSDKVVQSRSGYTITGSDYVAKELFRTAAGSCAKTDVGLYHQTWTEWTGGSGCSLGDLPNHNIAVCGDVHVRGAIAPPIGPKLAVSPGPLAPQSVAEFATPAVYAVGQDTGAKEVPLRGRRYQAFDVADGAAADAVIEVVTGIAPDGTLPEAVRAPMVSVRLTGSVDGFEAALNKIAAANGVIVRWLYATSARPEKAHARPIGTGLTSVIINWDADPTAKHLAAAVVAKGTKTNEPILAARDEYERGSKGAADRTGTT